MEKCKWLEGFFMEAECVFVVDGRFYWLVKSRFKGNENLFFIEHIFVSP